jgi:hypothetical protein
LIPTIVIHSILLAPAYGSEPEIIDIETKTAVIFLLGDACKPNLYNDYVERFSAAWIVCVGYSDWQDARANLYGFESLYHVLYVTQDNQHEKASQGVKGEAWFRNGADYAYSINNPIAIQHELQHLQCGCHFTPDGKHDYEKDDLIWLWRAEH